jgi:Uma2 family endonuclease
MVSRVTEGPPVLESGDRLSREEFHLRYSARPDIKRAELINGVVYVASPVSLRRHGEPHGLVVQWLRTFVSMTRGLRFGDNATVYLNDNDEVQPDAFVFWDPPREPGAAHETDDGYVEGPPLLVVEVAASSASYDLHDKKEAYRRAGVPEYIVWRIVDRLIEWFHLRDGEYVRLEADEDGLIESRVLPGLRLPLDKMLAGDDVGVLAAIGVRL